MRNKYNKLGGVTKGNFKVILRGRSQLDTNLIKVFS